MSEDLAAGDYRRQRFARLRAEMALQGVDTVLCSLGADLPYLSGYEAMPLERLTMLVVPLEQDPTLVVPALEAARVEHDEKLFSMRAWKETEDPIRIVAELAGLRERPGVCAISDRTWSMFVLALQGAMPNARFVNASNVTSPLRRVKDALEVKALKAAAQAADRVAKALLGAEIALIGRSESQVSAEIGRRLVEEGHSKVNFAIVGSGPNSASPHHEPSERKIGEGEVVVCDFGGTFSLDGGPGYCSDITRTVVTGEPDAAFLELYEVLRQAQMAAVSASTVGNACSAVDWAARSPIEQAGFGEFFVHRTGHGIGLEEHEDPYLVSGNDTALEAFNAFSIEPGIYLQGRYGARIEDIVIASQDGPQALNKADHCLTIVQA